MYENKMHRGAFSNTFALSITWRTSTRRSRKELSITSFRLQERRFNPGRGHYSTSIGDFSSGTEDSVIVLVVTRDFPAHWVERFWKSSGWAELPNLWCNKMILKEWARNGIFSTYHTDTGQTRYLFISTLIWRLYLKTCYTISRTAQQG